MIASVRYYLFILAILFLFYPGPAFSDTTVSGRISEDTTWTLAESPYIVTLTVQVYGTTTVPVTLTIEPGVVVKFNSYQGLQIGSGTNQGALIAQGTVDNRITFTRSGTSGNWSTLSFQDGTIDSTTVIEYADIQYSSGVMMTSASPAIRNSTITDVAGYGMNLTSSHPSLENVALANNGYYGIYLNSSSPIITGGSLTNSSATGQGIYGSGSPVISNHSVSIVNTAGKYGVYLSSTTSALSITGSTIGNGLYLSTTNITPAITGNTFTNSDSSPVHAGANIIGQILNNNTFTEMTSAGRIEVVGEQMKQDSLWKKWPAPYAILGAVYVYKDAATPATLTIEPGVMVKFNAGCGLQIGSGANQGALIAQGTATDGIVFTRNNPSGTWGALSFQDGTVDGTTVIEYADIQYSSGVSMISASPAIRNSMITEMTGYVSLSTSNTIFENVTIENSGSYGMSLSNSSPVITGGNLTNTNAAAHGIYGSGSPVLSNYQIAMANTPNKYGVYLNSTTSALSITGSTIGNGLYLSTTNITPTITGNTFTNSDSSPLHAGANIIAQILNNNTFTEMTSAGRIEVVGEQVKQDSLWKKWPAAYAILGTVSVYKDTATASTLTIEPGTILKFNPNTGLQAGYSSYRGVLNATGTLTNKIRFTSNQQTPAPGNWTGITFQGAAASASVLDHVIVEYGGSTGAYNYGNLMLSSSSPTVRNSAIANSAGSGIYLSYANANPSIANCSITGNKWGVYSSYSNPVISLSSIASNITAGVWNASPATVVEAANNWWGAASGPTHASNPGGSGSVVSDGVSFSPWLTQEPGSSSLVISDAMATPASLNPEGDFTTITATISELADWTVVIADSAFTPVRSISGTGTVVQTQWSGEDEQGVKVADGAYYFWVEAVGTASGAQGSSPQGLLMVSRQLPVAIITLPTDNGMFAGGAEITVSGTAMDETDFKNYTLSYGAGENPSSWIVIKTVTTPVTNGMIHTWNTSTLPGGLYTLKLSVTDNANNVAEEKARVRLLWIQDAALSEAYISPNGDAVKDAATISAAFTHESAWTIAVKDPSDATVRTYTGSGSSVSQAWDGKDEAGLVVPDGDYTYRIDAVSVETSVQAAPKSGSVVVDDTLPETVIAVPVANAVIGNTVTVTGTASDGNLDTYNVEYGPADGAGPWTQVASSTSSVTSGPLANWVTNDAMNAVLLANGGYLLRLTATDKAGNSSETTVPVSVSNLLLTDVSASSAFIDTLTGGSSVISYTVNTPANVTLKIIPELQGPSGAPAPVYTSSQELVEAGSGSFVWDGKNNAGTVVQDEAYLYVLEATDGTRSDVYSPPALEDEGTVTCSQESTYDPYKNDPLTISYTVSQPGRIDLTIAWGASPFKVLDGVPHVPGSYAFDWDGRNPGGKILANGGVAYCAVASLLRENAIITNGDMVKITDLKTDPYEMHFSYGQYTKISYDISRAAIVTVSLVPTTGSEIVVTNGEYEAAGAQAVDWNGLDAADATGKQVIVSQDGNYMVRVQAVNSATGTVSTGRGSLKIGN